MSSLSTKDRSLNSTDSHPENQTSNQEHSENRPIWQVTISSRDGQEDRRAQEVKDALALGVVNFGEEVDIEAITVRSAHGFLLQGDLDREIVASMAKSLLVDTVVENFTNVRLGEGNSSSDANSHEHLIHVLPMPGVTDAEADSALDAMKLLKAPIEAVRTFEQYRITGLTTQDASRLAQKLLANDSIEQIVLGPLELARLDVGNDYQFALRTIEVLKADDNRLLEISKTSQLSLTLVEMQTIQQYFRELEREPTDIELETLAQTWSEHCSHKTLAGRIEYRDENGTQHFENMLKETIFAATQNIRKRLADQDWCVSVFKDNAGIIKFDETTNLTFKVETHNRPSAIEPYGGASTGIGGVIRDTLGTGMGAKPICNTDVFCFANPNTALDQIPPGVMHPRRIMQGVVSGVRDYGNRMGIPTVNGAVYFDQRYIGNPLVFCGNVGMLEHEHSFKAPQPNDLIVAVGGRTGRDGIHGATFSSVELTDASEKTSSGAVQIGNPIVEKKLVDVLLQARDRGLYNAVTDCGAGGFSSAVGEMGEEIGAEVWLEKAPLKYDGLSYTEIWISEAQERMVCSVPESKWQAFKELCESENVEATIIGEFTPTKKLTLKYKDNIVGDLGMDFMHNGRPPTIRKAIFEPRSESQFSLNECPDPQQCLLGILSSLNVASKHWIIRQYDHEVLGRSVIKPLVGLHNDGPSDAAVIRPKLESKRGAVVACGMNPLYGDLDPYHMAASSINEALRNCVAVGADPSRIAILDNFCWGYTDRPETLGTLVRAALACRDLAEAYGTPFISGKDSLNNEFSYQDHEGARQTISIPSTLLISALGQIDDVHDCVTMDFKQPGNLIYQVGETLNEMGGSHFGLVNQASGGSVPKVVPDSSQKIFEALHGSITKKLVRSCHDLSEGGFAVALSEMAIGGNVGCDIKLDSIPIDSQLQQGQKTIARLFSESNSRFLIEVRTEHQAEIESMFRDLPLVLIGTTNASEHVRIEDSGTTLIQARITDLRSAWQHPLDWNHECKQEQQETDNDAN